MPVRQIQPIRTYLAVEPGRQEGGTSRLAECNPIVLRLPSELDLPPGSAGAPAPGPVTAGSVVALTFLACYACTAPDYIASWSRLNDNLYHLPPINPLDTSLASSRFRVTDTVMLASQHTAQWREESGSADIGTSSCRPSEERLEMDGGRRQENPLV